MLFELEKLNVELLRNPDTMIFLVSNKSEKKELRKTITQIKKKFPFLEKYKIEAKYKSEEIKEIDDLVYLDKKKEFYNTKLITIGQLIEVTSSITRTQKVMYKMKFKVPEKYSIFEAMYIKNEELDSEDIELNKYYIINGSIKRDGNTIENEKFMKKSYKMLGIEAYEFWIKEMRKVDYEEEEEEDHEFPRYPLHCHTKGSMRDAMIDEERVKKAFKSGKLGSFAITDHRDTMSFLDFKRAFGKDNYPILAGVEAEVFDDLSENFNYEEDIHACKRYHMVLIGNQQDIELEYKGKKFKANESIRAFNTLISNANIKYYSVPTKENKGGDGEFANYRRPIMSLKEVLEYRNKGILKIGSACIMGTVRYYWMKNDMENFKKYFDIVDWVEIHPVHNEIFMTTSNVFPEITKREQIVAKNLELYQYCKKMGKDVVFSDDAHVINKKDRQLRSLYKQGEIAKIAKEVNKDVLEKLSIEERARAIRAFEEDFAEEKQPFLHSYSEMVSELKLQGFKDEEIEDMYQTEKRISLSFPKLQDMTLIPNVSLLPEFPGVNAKIEVPRIAKKFAIKKWSTDGTFESINKVIKDRLDLEINALATRNYEFLYYSAMWLVKQSVNKGYLVGSRGSVGSSLLAYCMEISENNPLKPHYHCDKCKKIEWMKDEFKYGVDYKNKKCECGGTLKGDGLNIEFSSFLGYKHDKVPDIDLNFSSDDWDSNNPIQTQVIQDLKTIYEETKSLVRAGAPGYTGEAAILANTLSKILNVKDKVKREVFDPLGIARELTGIFDQVGQHPGGILVWDHEEGAPDYNYGFAIVRAVKQNSSAFTYVASIDYHPLEEFCPKLDILAKADPALVKTLMDETGTEEIILNNMQYNDPKIIAAINNIKIILPNPKDINELYYKQGTLGIPELGTPFIRNAIELCKPESFTDIVKVQGLTHGTGVLELAKPLLEEGYSLEDIPWTTRDFMFSFFYKKYGLDPEKAFKGIEFIRKGKWKAMPQELKDYLKEKLPKWVYNSVSQIVYLFPSAQ